MGPGGAAGQVPPDEAWQQADTEHFVVTYPARLEGLVGRAATSAERAWTLLEDRFAQAPDGKVQLLLTDHTDFANGFATPVPFNRVTVFVRPPMDGDNISYFDDWLELVITHELVHTFHLDLKGTLGTVLRSLFGRLPSAWPVFPSGSTPTWMVEGLATYFESALTDAGRVKGTWHEMVVRTAALEGAFGPVDQVSGVSPVWPDGNRPYAFGASYLAYMSDQYGEDALGGFARAVSRQWIPFRINAAAHDAFGVTVADSWTAWREGALEEYGALARRLADSAPLTRGEPIETAGRFAQQAMVSRDGSVLAFARSDGVDKTQIRLSAPDGSDPRSLTRINGVATLSWAPDGSLLFPQLDYTDRYRLTSDVYRVNREGSVERLTHGQRLTYPDVAPDGARIVAVQEGDGTNELVLVDVATRRVTEISPPDPLVHWAFPRWSPDGASIAVVRWSPPAMMDIVVLDPDGAVVGEVTQDRALDTTPFWSPDGTTLLWSSDRTGIPNLFAARVGGRIPQVRQVTNVLGGATHPSVDALGRWIYFSSYHADGWHVERIPYDPGGWFSPQATDERFGSTAAPARRAAATAVGEGRPYSALSTLRPYYWTPLFGPPERAFDQTGAQRDVVRTSVGLQIEGSDLIGRHAYSAAGRVSLDGERFLGGLGYTYSGLGNPTLGISLTQGYDAAPRSLGVQFPDSTIQEFFLVERERRALASATFVRRRVRSITALSLSGGLIREDLTLQDLGGGEGPTLSRPRPRRTFAELRATLSGANTQRRAFSFSAEDGVSAFVFGRVRRETDLATDLQGVLGEDRGFQEVVGEVAAFKALGGPGYANHVLAVRLSAGAGFGAGANQFHFDLGGTEGSAESFSGLGLFGGVPLLFPVRGYPRDFRFGRYAWSASAEYRFPLVLVDRGLGAFPLYLDRLHGAVFFDVGNAWGPELGQALFDNPAGPALAGVGGEVSVMLTPFYAGRLTLRLGAGVPLRILSDPRFYVRVGNAF